MPPAIRIGTRGSTLALWQARKVAQLLEEQGAQTEIVVIRTSGDERQGPPVAPGTNVKRMFVKEIEEALLAGTIDVAVHSMKDMPTWLPDGLTLPDVSASLWRTWVDGLEYGDLGDDEIAFDADVATWSGRVDVSKAFGVVTPYAGAGLDRTGVDARYRIPAGSATGGQEIEGSIDAGGTQAKAYAGLELNLLVMRASAEVGRGSSGTFVGVALGF